MTDETTTISIKKSTWQMLNAHRQCGETMDDVIVKLFGKKIVVTGMPMY